MNSLCIKLCVLGYYFHRLPFHHLPQNALVTLEMQALLRA